MFIVNKIVNRYTIVFLALVFSTSLFSQRQIEELSRGVVAMRKTTNQVFVSWRWLGTESGEVAFNVYRGDTKLNDAPITGSTNYIDNSSASASYSVSAIINGVEQERSESAEVWSNNYMELNLNRPLGGTTPDGVNYTYTPNDCSVGDMDGDGEYEIVVKWDPSNSKDNSQSGYTGNVFLDAYKMDGTQLWRIDLGRNIRAGAHYTQYLVYDFDGDGKAEVACKTAPGTKDNSSGYLHTGPAASDNDAADYRTSSGYILSGPEYLTVFSGVTGNELATVNYTPSRGSVSSWGDSYGNRVDRFLACVAYLDGEKPSLVMTRGYYTRSVLSAWDWDGTNLSQRWIFDSNTPGNGAYYGQGNHNLSVADVDQDGKDEIIYGSCTIDDDGTGLYSTGLGHGDALHVSDMDPDRPGLEVFMPHESGGNGMTYRDAKTGEILWQLKAPGTDVGRGVAADISPEHRGFEFWSSTGEGTYNLNLDVIGGKPSMNFLVWWDGDVTRELLNNISITKYNGGTLLNAVGCASNNGTKATPNLSADILGDWREEVILRTTDNTKLRIYSTDIVTDKKFITLMHDPQYRLAIAWQNVGYNQPPHPGFYLGNGMETPPLAPISQAKLKWTGSANYNWDTNNTQNWVLKNGTAAGFNNGDDVLFSMSGNNGSQIEIGQTLSPSKVTVISPTDYVMGGSGKLTGSMELVKGGTGKLTVNTNNDYTGPTLISEGELWMNGDLSNSVVEVKNYGLITGEGTYAGVSLLGGSELKAGNGDQAGTTTINGNLNLSAGALVSMDLSDDPTGSVKANDMISIVGDVNIAGPCTLAFNKLNGTLSEGSYTLISYTGAFTGTLDHIAIEGIRELIFSLKVINKSIVLEASVPRAATSLIWDGTANNTWNLLKNTNWLNNGVNDVFVVGDRVVFNNSGNPQVIVEEEVSVGGIEFSASNAYIFSGDGSIAGEGGLLKNGGGYLTLNDNNTFTGKVEINAGYVQAGKLDIVGRPSSIGSGSSDAASLSLNGGALRFGGSGASTNRKISIGSTGGELFIDGGGDLTLDGTITGDGVLTKRGPGILKLSAQNTLSGAVNLVEGTLYLVSETANSRGLGTDKVVIKNATLQMLNSTGSYSDIYWNMEVPEGFNATLNLDGRCDHYGDLTGGGTLNLNTPFTRAHLNGDWSAFTGDIVVNTDNNGWFICGNSKGYGNASVHLGNNVFALYKNSSDEIIEIGDLTGTSSSVLGAGGQATNQITWKIGGKNASSTFDGRITNDQYKNSGAATAIVKTGSGRWTLSNSNTYLGGTSIERGSIVAANASGSATGTGAVTVQGNASLAGTGSVDGPVTVNNRGYIMPGLSASIGNLTINNDLAFLSGSRFYVKTDAAGGNCDKVTVSGSTALSGTLYMTLTNGSFSAGQSFQILNCANITGAFEAISPAAPGAGLYWDLSQLSVNGKISVSDVPTAIHGEKGNEIRIYPNPMSDYLYVDSDTERGISVEIRDVNGQLVYENSELQSNRIDVSHLSKGVYFIKISSGQKQWVDKIVKQ